MTNKKIVVTIALDVKSDVLAIQLRDHHKAFSQEELGKVLIQTIRDYISHTIELYELIEISETMRLYHKNECSKQVLKALQTLNFLREDLVNPSKDESIQKEIPTRIDKTLTIITGTSNR